MTQSPEWIAEFLSACEPGTGIQVTTADGRFGGGVVSYEDEVLTLALGANVVGPVHPRGNVKHRRFRLKEIDQVAIAHTIVD